MLTVLADADRSGDLNCSTRDFAADAEDPERVAQQLYHAHLQKLAEAGYVEWDHEHDVVRPGARFDEVEPFVSVLADLEDWP